MRQIFPRVTLSDIYGTVGPCARPIGRASASLVLTMVSIPEKPSQNFPRTGWLTFFEWNECYKITTLRIRRTNGRAVGNAMNAHFYTVQETGLPCRIKYRLARSDLETNQWLIIFAACPLSFIASIFRVE